MLTKDDIERILEKYPWLPKPKYIYILNAPIIYPELRAKIIGINPAYERQTVILSSDADEETLVHECIHVAGLGEIAAYGLAPRIVKFRKFVPPLVKKKVRYEERTLTSDEMKRYGLYAFKWADGYIPAKLEVKVLELKNSS